MRGPRPTTGTGADGPIRDRLDRLGGLPLRPSTVRSLLRDGPGAAAGLDLLDPGWAVLVSARGPDLAPELLAELPFWSPCDVGAAEARDRLWRFSVATALAARRLAELEGDPDPDASGRSGLLHPIALWALAAVAPNGLSAWLEADDQARRRLESSWFGRDPADFGHSMARRWGCDPDVLDATLFAGRSNPVPPGLVTDPAGLDRLRAARRQAMRTPWALPGPRPEIGLDEVDRRGLLAKVQSLSAGGLTGGGSPADEAELLRDASRLFARNRQFERELGELDRRLSAAIGALDRPPTDPPFQDPGAVLDAMAEFAAGAAHELNNPLAIVAGRAQLLQARLEDPEHRLALQTIIGQARRAHQILRDLIYIARPPSPRRMPCVPDRVLRDAVEDLQDEARSREIQLSSRLSRSSTAVSTDPEALRHLADALLRNALEATDPGGEVVLESIDDPRSIVWEVRDNGIGLDEDRAAHLLDPFYCGRQAGRGLGLGLPRVARFVSAVGGRIRWESADGPGTVVRVELPIGVVDEPATIDLNRPGVRDAS
ncbi:ATP-binding protein [Tautonia plasticadhaerens]|uniref:histidine kinase n=1 Tax=Tautonia plasticadhaerens TaxID=2527974 RepID=A0A518H8Q8_9BACT|nr:ATP-binding protein [Tautonia plasticadhaerens]QDV37224.1 Sporulation kinase E [Tautonia plasticadhaerens]